MESTEEWVIEMWYIYTMEHCSLLGLRKKSYKFIGKCMNLETIILGEVTQAQKDKHDMFFLSCVCVFHLEQKVFIFFFSESLLCQFLFQYSPFQTATLISNTIQFFYIPLFPLDLRPIPKHKPIPGTVIGATNLCLDMLQALQENPLTAFC